MMSLASKVWNTFVRLRDSEEGAGTLEIILIIAVIIIIALLFKDWIIELVQDLMNRADDQANTIFDA